MAFLVEDGTIVAGATSYTTVAYYKAYWLDRGVTVAETDPVIEAALVIVTQYVDLMNRWKGCIVDDAQPLDWPRYDVWDDELRYIESNEVPARLQNAICEYASAQIVSTISPEPSLKGEIKVEMSKLGTLEEEIEYTENSSRTIRSIPLADNWLKGFTVGGLLGNFSRTVRC